MLSQVIERGWAGLMRFCELARWVILPVLASAWCVLLVVGLVSVSRW